MIRVIRTYSELMKLPTFQERFNYLRLNGDVGKDTFGFDRKFNQSFYRSAEWKRIRDIVITRDLGCDLGIPENPIRGKILIHHMNPISMDDITNATEYLMDPEYLICVSHVTHNAIHYGDDTFIPKDYIPRSKNDTCPWMKED